MSSINILTLIVHRILSVILLCLKFLFILTLIHYHSVEYLNLANQKKEREGETSKMQTSLLTMILVVFFNLIHIQINEAYIQILSSHSICYRHCWFKKEKNIFVLLFVVLQKKMWEVHKHVNTFKQMSCHNSNLN